MAFKGSNGIKTSQLYGGGKAFLCPLKEKDGQNVCRFYLFRLAFKERNLG